MSGVTVNHETRKRDCHGIDHHAMIKAQRCQPSLSKHAQTTAESENENTQPTAVGCRGAGESKLVLLALGLFP